MFIHNDGFAAVIRNDGVAVDSQDRFCCVNPQCAFAFNLIHNDGVSMLTRNDGLLC